VTARRGLATGASAFATFIQVLPRLPSVIRQMRPTWHRSGLRAVDERFLRANGIRGLIWDVDGTLTGDRRGELAPECEGPFRALIAIAGVSHVVLSNAGEERYVQLGALFPTMPILRAYAVDGEVLCRRRLGADDSWTPEELERRLAAGARVIRKPSAALVDFAVRELRCAKDEALMIGDQYMTDVSGANMGGVRSVKVPTLAPETFRTVVKFTQWAERMVYGLVHGRAEIAA
jgi:predicted HAD superfamily phosphohydrolase YqeG